MGTDIHVVVQAKREDRWETVAYSCGEWGRASKDGVPFRGGMPSMMDDRNYLLFGILGGVRCYDVVPIDRPRGIPDDSGIEADGNKLCVGDYGFSWLTAAEIASYPWNGLWYWLEQGGVEWGGYTPRTQLWLTETLSWLTTFGAPDEVRIIYGFDS